MAKKKTPKVKAAKATSAYNGVNNYNVDLGPFGSANSSKTGDTINTQTQLSPGLQSVYNTTSEGLNNNLQSLNQNPTQQLQDLNAGNNSFYNLSAEQNQRYLDDQLAKVKLRNSQNGLDNSTVYGGMQGTALNDATLRDLTTRNQSITNQNALANQNVGTQNAVLQGLAGINNQSASMANQNLQTGFGSLDQVSLANAQMQQQANMQNAQLQAQANAQRQSMWGQIANAGIQLGGLALAPMTGGTSLMAAQGLGGLLGGGGGASAQKGLSGGGLSAVPFLGTSYGGF